jgi:lipase chaperone LimK
MVFTTSEDEHIALLMSRQLDHEMRRSAESVEPQVFARTNPRKPIRAISDNARAKQRRGMLVGEEVRNGIAELSRHDAVFRISAIHVISSKAAIEAEVLKPATTVFAASISRVQPCDPDSIPFLMVSDA